MTGDDLLPVAVLRLGPAGRIETANDLAAAVTGWPVPSLVGADCGERLDARRPDGRPLLRGGWHPSARLRSVRGVPEREVVLRDAAGAERRVLAVGRYRRDGAGAATGLVLVLRPAGGTGGGGGGGPSGMEVVSTVSHELRSPLTSVKGYTSLLLHRWDRLGDDQKRLMLEQVHHDADRVTRLVGELLDISRLETGRLVLRRQLVDLAALARSVFDKVVLAYPALDGEVDVDPAVPPVYADPDKLEQVLTNLVENAAKYGDPVGVRVVGRADGDTVRVTVSDRGPGIAPEDLPLVFTKFFRREQGRPTGTGLGLWISRGLVEAHGGRLTASSRPGDGATFCFTLPATSFEDLHPR